MSERAPYSRVYWAIADDPKFASIYDDNDHLATWLRLLLQADGQWPASAPVPASARKGSVKALVDAGLVDLVSGGRFRIHGLDAERGRRREAARTGPVRLPSATQTGTERDPNGFGTRGLRRDETRHTETTRARNTVDKDPLLKEFRDTIREKYGNGMDEPMELQPVDIRRKQS